MIDVEERDPAKPRVKRLEGFDPPKYGVEIFGVVRTEPAEFDDAVAEANRLALEARWTSIAHERINVLLDEAIEDDPDAFSDAIEHIFPGENDVHPCP